MQKYSAPDSQQLNCLVFNKIKSDPYFLQIFAEMLLIPMLFDVLIPNMMFSYGSNNYTTTNTYPSP